MPRQHRFVAIDTDVLLALEAGDPHSKEAIQLLSQGGFCCLATETPLQELADIFQLNSDPEAARHAAATLKQLSRFGILMPRLAAVEMGVVERVALKVCDKLVRDGCLNDGLVIAEAAYNHCRILVTRKKTLLAPKTDSLRMALVDFDLSPIVVACPSEVVNYFRKR